MEEKIFNGEQPEITNVHTVATDGENGTSEMTGSPLGKFKDSEKLLDAYNELQSEFTRKCQRLSEAEKKLQDISLVSNTSEETETKVNEFAWNKNISEFLQSHKNASLLVEEITNEIINDNTLRESEDGLEKAYARVIEKKYIPESELVRDENFLTNYIYSNEEIKNKIIQEYVASLQNSKNPITVNNSSFNRGVAVNNKFTSLEDAKKYVEHMFKF